MDTEPIEERCRDRRQIGVRDAVLYLALAAFATVFGLWANAVNNAAETVHDAMQKQALQLNHIRRDQYQSRTDIAVLKTEVEELKRRTAPMGR